MPTLRLKQLAQDSAVDGQLVYWNSSSGRWEPRLKHNLAASTNPGATDDSSAGYEEGSIWVNTSLDLSFICVDSTATSAIWVNITEIGDVTAAATITDNVIVRGDGGSKGVQASGISISDTNQLTSALTATFSTEYNNGNQAGPSWTLNWNNGQKQRVTLTGSISTLTITAPPGPGNFILKIIQDATGSRSITWPSSVLWPGGTGPTLSGASATDIVSMYYDGTNYYSQAALAFA